MIKSWRKSARIPRWAEVVGLKSLWFTNRGNFHWATFFCDLYYVSDPRPNSLFLFFLLIWDDVTARAKQLFSGQKAWGPDNYDERMELHLSHLFRRKRKKA